MQRSMSRYAQAQPYPPNVSVHSLWKLSCFCCDSYLAIQGQRFGNCRATHLVRSRIPVMSFLRLVAERLGQEVLGNSCPNGVLSLSMFVQRAKDSPLTTMSNLISHGAYSILERGYFRAMSVKHIFGIPWWFPLLVLENRRTCP